VEGGASLGNTKRHIQEVLNGTELLGTIFLDVKPIATTENVDRLCEVIRSCLGKSFQRITGREMTMQDLQASYNRDGKCIEIIPDCGGDTALESAWVNELLKMCAAVTRAQGRSENSGLLRE
jgi:hypothetical protein